MRDPISIPRANMLHPKVRQEVIDLINKAESNFPANIRVRIVQGLRTIDEQNALYAQGRTKPGPKVTNAKGGSSYHNYGLAIDFALLYDKDNNGKFETLSWDINADQDKDLQKDWQEVVKVFEAAGWSWGGKWNSSKDYPHLEKTFGLNWRELKRRHDAKDFDHSYVRI